jgi:hypothetical protein
MPDQSNRTEIMYEFIKMLENQYGRIREYIKRHTGLLDDEITAIRDINDLLCLPTFVSR